MSSRRNRLAGLEQTLTPQVMGERNTHPGLWLDKYIEDQSKDNALSRHKLVNQVAELPVAEAYNAFYAHWEKMLIEYGAQTRKATVQGRMIIGLGDESVLETSVTLHRTYGIPYIPGSALKGLAASYIRQKLSATEAWRKDGEAYQVIFGETANAGYITFFDALYIPGTGYQKKVLYPDVITVHHRDYYQDVKKAKVPADWDSPTPIPFLSATGTYLIALAAPELEHFPEWVNTTFTILKDALGTMGIGAKTSSGYGRMALELPSALSPVQKQAPAERIRPNIPKFREGQEITGSVVAPSEELRRRAPADTKAFLRYQSFATKDVLMVVSAEEAQNWKPGETRNCLFVREEVREGCAVLVCQPRPSKKKKG